MKDETAAEALGLDENFASQVRNDVRNGMERHDKISDILLETSMGIKNDEFGKGPWEITPYEKKLIILGMEMAAQVTAKWIKKKGEVDYETRTRK